MYLLGHVGISIFVAFLIDKFRDDTSNKIMVGLGSMLPDLIDKPIGSLFFNTGRWLGHAVLVQTVVFLLLYYFSTDKSISSIQVRELLVIFYLGSIGHLFLDFPGISRDVVLWPLFGSFEVGNRSDFLLGFESTRTIISEVLGIVSLISVGFQEKWERKYWLFMVSTILVYLSLFLIFYTLLVGW